MMGRKAVAASVATLACVGLPAAAMAAPAKVPPREIASGAHLIELKLGVSPLDEAITVIGGDNSGGEPTLSARVRGADGRLSQTQELSRTTNAELPRDIEFNSAGSTFLSWGIGSASAQGQHAFRKAGGLFSVPMTWPGGLCTRFSSVRFLSTGMPQIACSTTSGGGPTNDLITTTSGTTAEGLFFNLATPLQGTVNDDFLTPQLDVGPDGTRAVAWKVNEGTDPTATSKIRIAVAPPSGGFLAAQDVSSVLTSSGGFLELGGMAVLADGRVAVIFDRNDGASTTSHLRIRKTDGTFRDTTLPTTTANGRLTVIRDGAGALVLWATDTGFGTPVVYTIAGMSGDTIDAASMQVLDNGAPSGLRPGGVLVAPNGAAAFVRSVPVSGNRVLGAWVRPARGRPFAGPFTIGSADGMPSFSAAIDRHGSIAASWIKEEGSGNRIFLGGLDAAGPTLSSLSVPARLRVGRSGRFSVKAVDPAGVKSIKWGFGDRSRAASGSRVGHSFSRTGRFRVVAVATDQAGKQTRTTRTVRVVR